MIALSQNDEQDGQEIMVDHATGDGYSMTQESDITMTQALEPPDKKQMQRSSSSSSSRGAKNDDHSTNRHLAGRTPRAMGGRGGGEGMSGRGGLHRHHHASTPSNKIKKWQQTQQQQNIQLSQKKNHHHRINPSANQTTHQQRPMVGNNHHRNFTTPVAAGSGRLLKSSKRNNGLSQSMMHEEDDTSTIQSRSLLTQDSQGRGGGGGGSRFGGQQQQQQYQLQQSSNGRQQQRSTMTMASNTTYQRIPSLSSSRQRPVASTAARTFGGGISTTLATLATPSRAFRSVTSFAARTAARTGATLGLTPCNFRSRSAAVLSSSRLTSSGATGGGGVQQSSLSKSVAGTNNNTILVKRSEEEEEDDDASKVTQKTYDPADEKDGVASLAAREEEGAVVNDENKKVDDFLSKVQTAMDDKMKQFDEKLNEKFTEKKQELEEIFERTTKTFMESVSKIEGIQEAMDAFPTKVASSTQEHEVQIRQLVGQSKEEIVKESLRVVESISANARAVADDEAKKSISEVVGNVIATAKSDFQVWTDGVLAGMRSSTIGRSSPVVTAASGEGSSTGVGANNSIEKADCEEMECCQSTVVSGDIMAQSNSDKENEQADTEEETTLSEEVDDAETKFETQTFDDNQSGKWSDDEEDATGEKEEVSKTGATSFSSKATPHYGDGMSTTTTPFSRKTTPLKNNYGKNKKSIPIQSSRTANDENLNPEVQIASPYSMSVSSRKKKRANGGSPSSPQIHIKLSSSSKKKRGGSPLSPRIIDNRKVKSEKKAPKRESKHKIKAKSPNQQKSPRDKEDKPTDKSSEVKAKQKNSGELNELAIKQKPSKGTDTVPQLSQRSEKKPGRSTKSESAPQLSQHSEKKQTESAHQLSQRSEKKRDQSAVKVEKSTRRSKRQKVTLKTRAEQAALRTQKKKAKASKAKQVTPLDDGARQVQSIATKKDPSTTLSSFHLSSSDDENNFDTELHTYPKNDDVDELLGTSVVLAETSGVGDDSSGLDDSGEGLVEKPKVKLFTPFQKGRRSKNGKKTYGGRKSKTSVAINTGKEKPEKAEKTCSIFSFKW